MTDEKQDLDNLLKHPGWLRLVEHGRQEIEARLSLALNNAANERDDLLALQKLRQVVAAREALEALLAWPKLRHSALVRSNEKFDESQGPVLSRRGSL